MKVGTKILIITLGTITCLVMTFFSMTSVLLVDSFDRLESSNAIINNQQADRLLENEIDTLRSNALSYASWDQTYDFALGLNPDYMRDVFSELTFQNLNINAVIVTNNTYDIITRLYYEDGIRALPTDFYAHLDRTGSDLLVQGIKQGCSGVLMVGSTPFLVSAQPIHRSVPGGGDENPAGVFVLAKMIDPELVDQFQEHLASQSLQVSIHAFGAHIDDFGNGSDYGEDLISQRTVVAATSEDSISGLSVVNDIYDRPALVIEVEGPRTLFNHAVSSGNLLLITLLLLSVLLFIATILLLQFFIISRIDRLNDGVKRIEDGDEARLPVRSDDELGSLAVSINRMVEGLKQSKRDLLENKRRYKAVVEDQTELIFRSTPEGVITFTNTAFLRRYVLSTSDPKGDLKDMGEGGPTTWRLGMTLPQDELSAIQGKVLGLTREEPVFEHEHELRGDDGTRWFQWTVRGIFNESGALDETQWVGRDVTDRIRLLDRLNTIDKIESLGVFAGGIAHDFNNYLTSIMGTLLLMKHGMTSGDPRYRRIEEAERSVDKATDLTKQLLTFSKGGEPIKKTVDIAQFVQETAVFVLHGSRITLDCCFTTDLPMVEADEGQLFQVISNLVINAKQAMPEGGNIDIRAEGICLEEGSPLPLPPGRYVLLNISDNGPGIPKEVLSKIFDPFFTTKADGTGLGLTIVHSIISRHGGFIDVTSEVGVGTTFTIYLSASEAALVREQPVEYCMESSSGRILLMDDEEMILEVTAELLRAFGFTVECALNGEQTLERYRQRMDEGAPYDVIIMDLTIRGGMGGREAIGRLKEMDPEVRAIVSSGYSNDPVMANFREHGFLGVVPKPYTVGELLDEVRRLMNMPRQDATGGLVRTTDSGVREGAW